MSGGFCEQHPLFPHFLHVDHPTFFLQQAALLPLKIKGDPFWGAINTLALSRDDLLLILKPGGHIPFLDPAQRRALSHNKSLIRVLTKKTAGGDSLPRLQTMSYPSLLFSWPPPAHAFLFATPLLGFFLTPGGLRSLLFPHAAGCSSSSLSPPYTAGGSYSPPSLLPRLLLFLFLLLVPESPPSSTPASSVARPSSVDSSLRPLQIPSFSTPRLSVGAHLLSAFPQSRRPPPPCAPASISTPPDRLNF